VHARRSGVAHLVGEDDATCSEQFRELLDLPAAIGAREAAPPRHRDPVERETPELLSIVHPDQRRAYPMIEVVRAVVDEQRCVELQPEYARNIIVGFAHLGGQPVGVVANDPSHLAGTLDIDASDKAARFIRTCDAFNVPIVTFVDVTGFLPGVTRSTPASSGTAPRCSTPTPRRPSPSSPIVRKSYGGAYLAMNSRDMGADVVLAWPTAPSP
jgi:methylmalonyl-CoA decarboxylase subunit alpha